MKAEPRVPVAGQIVRVRQRLYLVEDCTPPVNPPDATLVRMSCVDDDAQGQPLEVLWERELDTRILTAEKIGIPSRLGASIRLSVSRPT